MLSHRMITAPSVILVSQPQLVEAGIRRFAEEQSLTDLPALYHDTPIGRLFDHLGMEEGDEDRSASDGEMLVEFAGRQCYRAWRKGRPTDEYLANILETNHGSVLAHAHFSFHISGISRACSLELNRHSAGVDISQESQRFVDGNDMCFVIPPALLELWGHDLTCASAQRWMSSRQAELDDYAAVQSELIASLTEQKTLKGQTLIRKRANEAARHSLPECSETQGVWTFNYRALRHILNLRGAQDADLEIRRLAGALAIQCKAMSPHVFYDVEIHPSDFNVPVITNKHEKP
jgi:thymidylate synthase (FAD)